MKMMESINNFVDTMINEKSQFNNIQNEVLKIEDDVSNELDNLNDNELKIIETLKGSIAESKDEIMGKIFIETSERLFSTISYANDKLKEAIKGMTFIHDFERQFTIAVFGKVKAGKSYIGNFLMGQTLRKLGIQSSYDKLKDLNVHVYDRGNMYDQKKLSTLDEEKECNGEEFYVNKSEATSTIQWVEIGGLCWFDTPGIGSVTMENEILAKEYVKNSDLVIFACNSDAAGTRQEFSEIKKLYEMGKPILLLLTQSDTYDFDVDDDGNEISSLVPKSEKDRRDQEQYMLDTLREQNMEDVLKYADILTVSTLLANEALKNNDEKMFQYSNIGKLLDKLTEITKNDAAEMKRNTPKSRINEMIDSIIIDLKEISEQIKLTCSAIQESKKNLLDKKDFMVENIHSLVNIKVRDIIAKFKLEVENSSEVISENRLSDEINCAITEIVKRICTEEAINSTEKIPDLNVNLVGIGDMKMRQDRIPYNYVSIRRTPRPPEGVIEKLGGFIFKKTYYTSKSCTETRYSTFDIGVNDNEISNNIVLQLNNVFSSTVDNYIDSLIRVYYEPIEILESKTTDEIKNTVEKLRKMKM